MDVTRDPDYPETPELDKLLVAETMDTYNRIMIFLDWAREEKVMRIVDPKAMVLEYVGVDIDALEAEQAAILRYIQGAHGHKTPPPVTMEVTAGEDKEVIEIE